jgi:hypothetical protein
MVLLPVRLSYADVMARSEQKEDLMLGASDHGASDMFDRVWAALDHLWNRPDAGESV